MIKPGIWTQTFFIGKSLFGNFFGILTVKWGNFSLKLTSVKTSLLLIPKFTQVTTLWNRQTWTGMLLVAALLLKTKRPHAMEVAWGRNCLSLRTGKRSCVCVCAVSKKIIGFCFWFKNQSKEMSEWIKEKTRTKTNKQTNKQTNQQTNKPTNQQTKTNQNKPNQNQTKTNQTKTKPKPNQNKTKQNEQTNKETTKEASKQANKQANNQTTTKQTNNQPTNQPTKQTTNQPTKQTNKQQTTNQTHQAKAAKFFRVTHTLAAVLRTTMEIWLTWTIFRMHSRQHSTRRQVRAKPLYDVQHLLTITQYQAHNVPAFHLQLWKNDGQTCLKGSSSRSLAMSSLTYLKKMQTRGSKQIARVSIYDLNSEMPSELWV